MEIQTLSKDIKNFIRSGQTISTIAQCVIELILNSVDAQSTSIAVRINTDKFMIQVIDNGIGINSRNLNVVGIRYMTNKCSSLEELHTNNKFYGYRGEALATIRTIARSLKISSRTKGCSKAYTKIFNEGKSKNLVEASRPSHGTTVIVEDIFYKTPVRQHKIRKVFDLEEIKKHIEKIALINHTISFSFKDTSNGQILFSLLKSDSISKTLDCLFSNEITRNLKLLEYERHKIKISGFICTETDSNKSKQFVYINKRFVDKSKIHKIVDYHLYRSSIIKPDVFTNKNNLKKTRDQCLKKHPIYIINITCPYSYYDITYFSQQITVEFKESVKILKHIERCIRLFLLKHKLNSNDTVIKNINNNYDLNTRNGNVLDIRNVKTVKSKPANRIINIASNTVLNKPKNEKNSFIACYSKLSITETIVSSHNNLVVEKHKISKLPKPESWIFEKSLCTSIKSVKCISSNKNVNRSKTKKKFVIDIQKQKKKTNALYTKINKFRNSHSKRNESNIYSYHSHKNYSNKNNLRLKQPNCIKTIKKLVTNSVIKLKRKESFEREENSLSLYKKEVINHGIIINNNSIKKITKKVLTNNIDQKLFKIPYMNFKEKNHERVNKNNTHVSSLLTTWLDTKTITKQLDSCTYNLNSGIVKCNTAMNTYSKNMLINKNLTTFNEVKIKSNNNFNKMLNLDYPKYNKSSSIPLYQIFLLKKRQSVQVNDFNELNKHIYKKNNDPKINPENILNNSSVTIKLHNINEVNVEKSQIDVLYSDKSEFVKSINKTIVEASNDYSLQIIPDYFNFNSTGISIQNNNDSVQQPYIENFKVFNQIGNKNMIQPDNLQKNITRPFFDFNNIGSIQNNQNGYVNLTENFELFNHVGNKSITELNNLQKNSLIPFFDFNNMENVQNNNFNNIEHNKNDQIKGERISNTKSLENNKANVFSGSTVANVKETTNILIEGIIKNLNMSNRKKSSKIKSKHDGTEIIKSRTLSTHCGNDNYNKSSTNISPDLFESIYNTSMNFGSLNNNTDSKSISQNSTQTNKYKIFKSRNITSSTPYNIEMKDNCDFSNGLSPIIPSLTYKKYASKKTKYEDTRTYKDKKNNIYISKAEMLFNQLKGTSEEQKTYSNVESSQKENECANRINKTCKITSPKRKLRETTSSRKNMKYEQNKNNSGVIYDIYNIKSTAPKRKLREISSRKNRNNPNMKYDNTCNIACSSPIRKITGTTAPRKHKIYEKNRNDSNANVKYDEGSKLKKKEKLKTTFEDIIIVKDVELESKLKKKEKLKRKFKDTVIVEKSPAPKQRNLSNDVLDLNISSDNFNNNNILIVEAMVHEEPKGCVDNTEIQINSNINSPAEKNILNFDEIYQFEPSNEKANTDWEKIINENGECMFIHKRSGMTKYSLESETKFSMNNRFEFLPKGLSQIKRNKSEKFKIISPTSKKNICDLINDENKKSAVSMKQIDSSIKVLDKSFEIQHFKNNYITTETNTFRKDILEHIQVLNQIDNKYIAAVAKENNNDIFVLFDQHAVDERIRLEILQQEYQINNTSFKKKILEDKMLLNLPLESVRVLQKHRHVFENLGIDFELIEDDIVSIESIPLCCYNKILKNKGNNINVEMYDLIEKLISEEISTLTKTRGVSNSIPVTILDIIKSEACRGAIKFGDYLTLQECVDLIEKLKFCDLPFQCAHGRPTMIPIIKINPLPEVNFLNLKKNIFC